MASPRRRKTEARRLLIMACSSRKSPAFGLLPAIERYDGVAFRVVKRLLRIVQFPPDVDVMILSAKYGLIGQDEPIGDYDLQMTPELAWSRPRRTAPGSASGSGAVSTEKCSFRRARSTCSPWNPWLLGGEESEL